MSERFETLPARPISVWAKFFAARDYAKIIALGDTLDKEAKETGLPGQRNGPQDPYRHALFAGELTRRYGPEIANELLELI